MKATYFFCGFTCLTQIFFTASYKEKEIFLLTQYLYVIPDTFITLELLSFIISLSWDCMEPSLLH